MVDAYPLQWPTIPRSRFTRRSAFGDHSIAVSSRAVHDELKRLGARNIVVSCNLVRNLDGSIRSSQRQPDDVGVAVYFEYHGGRQCIAVDRWNKIEHNLWAIAKSIEALRSLDRWGGGEMVQAAFSGFRALPPPDGSPSIGTVIIKRSAREILEIPEGQMIDREYLDYKFKKLAKERHPDTGGSAAAFQELKEAYETLKGGN